MRDNLRDTLQSSLGSAYSIERELAGGAMARVFLAEEHALGRRVVLKILPPELTAELNAERFRREIRIAAGLQHPLLVPVLSAGESNGLVYYTMPFVDGESLRGRLEREKQLPITEATSIAADLAEALAYAHQRGVIHRDVKPDNVLLSGGHALLADFGIAKAIDFARSESLTATGMSLGTPAYIAPEQAAGERDVDGRADIYSLGCLLFEMLTGQAPFGGPSTQSILAQHVAAPAPSARVLRPTVPPRLDAIVQRAMAKNPVDRFPTAADLCSALRRLNQSGEARPGLMLTRRRALGVAIVAALALLTWLLRANRAPATRAHQMIAVLPFRNLGSGEDAYFAEGITEEITNRLAALQGIGVISRTSADAYRGSSKTVREIGRELGVDFVLEGTVQWDRSPETPGRVRVSSQLIRVRSDSSLWSDHYDANLTSVFQVQGNIAERVASVLDIRLRAAEQRALALAPTSNLEAYDAFLRANELRESGGGAIGKSRAAEELYERAIALDSGFALAHAGLSQVLTTLYRLTGAGEETLARARAAAERAIHLAPETADGYDALGRYYSNGSGQVDSALVQYNRALALRPNDALAMNGVGAVLTLKGDYGGSISEYRRSARLNPRSAVAAEAIVRQELWLRRYAEAEHEIDAALARYSDDPAVYLLKAATMMLRSGDSAGAHNVLTSAARRVGAEKIFATYSDRRDMKLIPPGMIPEVASVTIPPDRRGEEYFITKAISFYSSGNFTSARLFADSASHALERRMQIHAGGGATQFVESALGLADAVVGKSQEALGHGAHALSIVTAAPDSFFVRRAVAMIDVMTGHDDEALNNLELLLSRPSEISASMLAVDPIWNRLHGNPRFRTLLSRCSPTEVCRHM